MTEARASAMMEMPRKVLTGRMDTRRYSRRLVAAVVLLAVAASVMGVVLASPAQSAVQAGTPVAWGDNSGGQTDVPSGLYMDVVDVAGGYRHSLALKSDGTVVAWGGQTDVPSGLTDVVDVSAGAYHNLALKADGTVVAWGSNSYGQSNVPSGLTDAVDVAAGAYHSLALKSDGTVVAWGDNSEGQSNIPSGLTDVVAVSEGGYHSLAIKADGTVVAWGDNGLGQSNVPSGLTGVVDVAGGFQHSLALKSDGTVVAWGYGGGGQTDVPSGLTGVVDVAAGAYHSLALKSDGTVVAWGSNYQGQGNVPSGLTDVVAVSEGLYHSLAVTTKIDTTAPSVSCGATPNKLRTSANNHKLVTITASVNVTDNSGGSGADGFALVSVTSNQADSGLGKDDVPNDIQGWATGTADTSGQLRAERYGAERIYTLTYRGKDQAGNTRECQATVRVPKG